MVIGVSASEVFGGLELLEGLVKLRRHTALLEKDLNSFHARSHLTLKAKVFEIRISPHQMQPTCSIF